MSERAGGTGGEARREADRRDSYRTELPPDVDRIPELLEELMRRGRAAGFPGRRLRFNFRVGVCEALANAIRHGGSDADRPVVVEAAFSARRIEVTITDSGGGFDPDDLPDPTAPENLTRSTGRGVFLMRKLMDLVEYNAAGNSLRMVLHARRRGSGRAP